MYKNLLATAGDDENIKIYDINKKKQLANIFGLQGDCNKLLSSEKYFLSANDNGLVYVIGK